MPSIIPSMFDLDNFKAVKLAECPFCGDTDLAAYTKGGVTGIVDCPCGACMHAELPLLDKDKDGRNVLSGTQIQQLERFRKKHRLATQVEAVDLWVKCLAVDNWNARANTKG